VPKNPAATLRWFNAAADQHLAVAEFNLGLIYSGDSEYAIASKDDAESARWIRRAAENGDATAQFLLAMSLGSGESSLPLDPVASKQWLTKAVDQNLPAAQLFLGMGFLRDGSGENEKILGVKHIRIAAEAGLGWAKVILAGCYQKGVGVPRDDLKAVDLLKDAAATGSVMGQVMLADIYEKGLGVPRDEALAHFKLNCSHKF
jgi:TPR repeat protein